MRVGINGAFWGMTDTGSGQYLHRLYDMLAVHLSQDELSLFLPVCKGYPWADDPRLLSLSTPFGGCSEDLGKVWFEQIAFPRACAGRRIEVAHVPYFAPPLFPPCPTVVTIHDLIPFRLAEYRGSVKVRLYMRLVARAAREATLILTDSRASADDIEALLRLPAERVRIVPLAAGPECRPLPPEKICPVLERLGIARPYMLYLGGFDRRKGVLSLLRAFADVERILSDVDLVIAGRLPAGGSSLTPDPRPLVGELELEDRVHFTGPIAEEDKPALLAGALFFLFPSLYEGFGLPALEAVSCGTPAIVTSGSSLEEIVGGGGLVVPPEDERALAKAMIQLAHDDALREELARQGLAHAANFSWDRTARETLAAYQEALSLSPISRLRRRAA
ncbi:MAG: glycosyltransferase family 4 protein [Chloroflexi bacterium]|nr:glycosyltransferase family 4 protein [Chloroflexota bacterium]